MERTQLLAHYRWMYAARQIDRLEQELTSRGEAFFQLCGSGHEGSVAIATHLTESDWLHCHYRDKALLLARGLKPRTFFDSLFCNAKSPSLGRRMSAFFNDRKLNILSMVTPTGNNALQAVGVAAAVRDQPDSPIVYCGVGDGTTQQGEFLEAIGEAVRRQLPVLFVIQDNKWAISTRTNAQTFYSLPGGPAKEFCGLPIHHVDGCDIEVAHETCQYVIGQQRQSLSPACVVLEVERLCSHTNADDQTLYRSPEELANSRDPLHKTEQRLLELGVSSEELHALQQQVVAEIEQAESQAADTDEPPFAVDDIRPIHIELKHPSSEQRGNEGRPTLTMRDAMREVLRDKLSSDPGVVLFGEDIEDPKGDVFGVTKGLSTAFPGRVCNSPLSESTIVGTSIGRALAGQRPVAFIQFADFLPLAYNQIASELATIYWRTAGRSQAPVILMVACGAYRPGLGPYHAQTMDTLMAHLPGVDVFMPSTATDAAGLLNAAFKSQRPTVFLYPKSLLNDPALATSADVSDQFVPIGVSRKTQMGRDITFVGWGNTVRLCQKAARALERAGVESEIIDLRSISPWDQHAVISSAEKTARLIVVHEDNHTAGFGAEVIATVAEKSRLPVAARRVTRMDTHIPCNFGNQLEVLPSLKRVLTTAAELLNLELTWQAPPPAVDDVFRLEAIGSGPADETVQIVEFLVSPGDTIQRGDAVASVEATKSVFDITSPVSGTVREIIANEGATVDVGATLMTLETGDGSKRRRPVTQENPGTPVFTRKKKTQTIDLPRRRGDIRHFEVGLSSVATVTGSRLVSNQQLFAERTKASRFSPADVFKRTGIESRFWAGEGENAVNMAVRACWKLFDQEDLLLDDLDLVICSTTSPTVVTPSMACQIVSQIRNGKSESLVQAYDINAACSGYLYALQAGYDFLQSRPDGRVMIVTAEVLSPLLDPNDFDTAILFGDATSASVLYGEAHIERSKARLHRPDLAAKSENGTTLSVPLMNTGYIQMQGRKVFSEAVRSMIASLTRVCQRDELRVDDLNLIVPHQANGRIIDAIQNRLGTPVYSNIRNYGNTSSTSIPLCLSDVLPKASPGDHVGLCAFGGGFTFGAGILEINS